MCSIKIKCPCNMKIKELVNSFNTKVSKFKCYVCMCNHSRAQTNLAAFEHSFEYDLSASNYVKE